ncbi:MAG: amino acid adenylation domain-containing protein [Pseudomonadota bacterium]|nr:amino acid adenylation domain-containing protein [Pseudomonadota bacterium]
MKHKTNINLNPSSTKGLTQSKSTLLIDRFESFASKKPNAIALEATNDSVSYTQLNSKANQISRLFSDMGINKGDSVVLAISASIDCIVAMLAILKTGSAFVPINQDWPKLRVKTLIENVNPKLVLYDKVESKFFDDIQCQAIAIDELITKLEESEIRFENRGINIEPENLCYIMHTSGTTGKPKGVMVTHQNIEGLFDNFNEIYFHSQDKWFWLHSLSFGFSFWEIWGALSHGACLVIAPEEIRRDPSIWAGFVEKTNTTILNLTPSSLRQFFELSPIPKASLEGSVRYVFLSGEEVRSDDVERWQGAFPSSNPRLINLFSLTESAGRIAIKDLSEIDPNSDSLIGKPMIDAELFIVEPDECKLSNEGELLIAGPMLSPGYFGENNLSKKYFINFDPGDGILRRCYRTGDRARFYKNGELKFLGRIDQQFKLRGYRIEPGDIEAALRKFPGIADAAVVVNKSASEIDAMTAFVVPDETNYSTFEFWPSLGEHLLYDELLYGLMSADKVRIASYQKAFLSSVKNKIVLDIGTGRDAILARMCIQAGAKKVYAVELLESAFISAKKLLNELGLNDQIEVIYGDISNIKLPEKIEVCTQGVVGNIGSSDGVVPLWNKARKWFADDFVAVPESCTTLIAPAELPKDVRERPAFTQLARNYLDQLFDASKNEFDPRLCVRNFPPENLLAVETAFEHLDFRKELELNYEGSYKFVIKNPGSFDGFLLWTRLSNQNIDSVDFLDNQQAWLPVWLPVAEEGVLVKPGDTISTSWSCSTSQNSGFPDYSIEAELNKLDGTSEKFEFDSPHKPVKFGQTKLHRMLASNEVLTSTINEKNISSWVKQHLPTYMIPSRWEFLDQLPINSNGKLDRDRLVELLKTEDFSAESGDDFFDLLESDISTIWSEVLGHSIGLNQNFFESGGDSILAVRLTTEIQRYLDETVFLAGLFDSPTIKEYSKWLRDNHLDKIEQRFGDGFNQSAEEQFVRQDSMLLSHAQQSLWFLHQLYPKSSAANEQFLIRINFEADFDRLVLAWTNLVSRHLILRTVFEQVEGEPRRIILSDRINFSQIISWENLSEEIASEQLNQLAEREISTRFDLSTGPLLRPVLISMPNQETVLLITAHHIIADGLTVNILCKELAELYKKSDSSLIKPEMQYGDYVYTENNLLQNDFLQKESQWWLSHLQGASNLPLLPSRNEVAQKPRSARHDFVISEKLSQDLRLLARSERASSFMVLLSLWRIWLSCCFDSYDLLLGTPMTLREDKVTAELPGCLVNNIVLRNTLKPDQSFREALIAERSALLEEWEHRFLPFDRVVEAVQPERVIGRHPLFQSMFFFDELGFNHSGFSTDVLSVERDSFWDLDLTISDYGPDVPLKGVISVRKDLIDAAQSKFWPDSFLMMVEAAVSNPDILLREIPLTNFLPKSFSNWNIPELDFENADSFYDLVAEQASVNPNAIAVIDQDSQLTYKQLIDLADSFSSGLINEGIRQGDVVGIAVARNLKVIPLLLGISKAGCAWLSLDSSYPIKRLHSMLSIAQPSLVIQEEDNEIFGDIKSSSLDRLLDSDQEHTSSYKHSEAFVLFTSGSTGEPKGVTLPVAGIINRCRWMWQEYNFGTKDCFAQRTGLNFVDVAWEIYGPLIHGGKITLMSPKLSNDPARMVQWFHEQNITHLVTVPILLDALLKEELSKVVTLHTVISSGELLSLDLLQKFKLELPNCRLLNTYCASEFLDATCARVDQLEIVDMQRVPIGHSIPNMNSQIMNSQNQVLPVGVPGEIIISGVNLAFGYISHNQLNEINFFSNADGKTLYRTGDLGNQLPNGALEFLGRADRQFNFNGIRVESADIEINMIAHPAVKNAALIFDIGSEYLKPTLFVQLAAEKSLSLNKLRDFLGQRLPQVLIPSDIRFLKDWPTTVSGKTNLQALIPLVKEKPLDQIYLEPRNELEKTISDIWLEVLEIDSVGIFDDFFILGGHSLLA